MNIEIFFDADEDPQDFLDWFQELSLIKRLGWDATKMPSAALANYVYVWRRREEENEAEAKAERFFNDTEATTLDEQCAKAKEKK